MKKRSESQIQAEKRYNQKRRGQPSIPAIRLTHEENQWVEQVFQKFGKTKKKAVLKGLRLIGQDLGGK